MFTSGGDELEVDGGAGCVAPSVETAPDGTYTPLSRPLYVYVKKTSFARSSARMKSNTP